MEVAAAAEGRSSQEASNPVDGAAVTVQENDANIRDATATIDGGNKFQKAIAAWRSKCTRRWLKLYMCAESSV